MLRSERNRIKLGYWVLEQLWAEDYGYGFDCGNDDLNEFFTRDVFEHDRNLLTKTYAFTPIGATVSQGHEPVALVAYCNDAIYQEIVERRVSKSFWKKFSRALPHPKRYEVFPAVKIARLGVQTKYAGQGAGTAMINATKRLFLTDNRTGCRFITVDSYVTRKAIRLYTENHFEYFGREQRESCEKRLAENPYGKTATDRKIDR